MRFNYIFCFFCPLADGGGDAYEPVSTVLLLFSPDSCSAGLYVALLSVAQVHKAEVQSGLVKEKLQWPLAERSQHLHFLSPH